MGDVIDFKKKQNQYEPGSDHMFTLTMYMTPAGEYEVEIEMAEWASDEQVFEALVGTAMQFGQDQAITESDDEPDLVIH